MQAERIYTETEFFAQWDHQDPGGDMGASPPMDPRDVTAFAKPMIVFMHLFSGNRRSSDLQHYWEHLGAASDYWIVAVSLDLQVDADRGDLSREEVMDFWLDQIYRGRVKGAHSGDPCSTWSAARFNTSRPGPRPVRSVAEPWGIVGLTDNERSAVELSNMLLRAVFRIFRALAATSVLASREHPADAGPSFPSTWKLPQLLDFIPEHHERATFDQCWFGQSSVKPTTLQGSRQLKLGETFNGMRCNRPRGTHVTLQGVDATGRFLTSYAH